MKTCDYFQTRHCLVCGQPGHISTGHLHHPKYGQDVIATFCSNEHLELAKQIHGTGPKQACIGCFGDYQEYMELEPYDDGVYDPLNKGQYEVA